MQPPAKIEPTELVSVYVQGLVAPTHHAQVDCAAQEVHDEKKVQRSVMLVDVVVVVVVDVVVVVVGGGHVCVLHDTFIT